MAESKYYVVKQKAVPEVLLKVVEAKRLLESGKARTVHDAAAQVGISRSSFYKYQDDIFPFHDDARGRTVTVLLQMEDVPGLSLIHILQGMRTLARNMSFLMKSIALGKEKYGVPMKEKTILTNFIR